jgi:hypothetical protein
MSMHLASMLAQACAYAQLRGTVGVSHSLLAISLPTQVPKDDSAGETTAHHSHAGHRSEQVMGLLCGEIMRDIEVQ